MKKIIQDLKKLKIKSGFFINKITMFTENA